MKCVRKLILKNITNLKTVAAVHTHTHTHTLFLLNWYKNLRSIYILKVVDILKAALLSKLIKIE